VVEPKEVEDERELARLRQRRVRNTRRAIRVVRARRRDPDALPWAHPSEDESARTFLDWDRLGVGEPYGLPKAEAKAIADAREYLDCLDTHIGAVTTPPRDLNEEEG
jgi:hypothetical protein